MEVNRATTFISHYFTADKFDIFQLDQNE